MYLAICGWILVSVFQMWSVVDIGQCFLDVVSSRYWSVVNICGQ